MINLILDQLKSMLKFRKYPMNLSNMVINMIQVGLHDPWIKMKPSSQSFVRIAKDWRLHGILLQIRMRHLFK